jgi:sugar O-acyltransferase (sialic acid O-acetyltransferase NeuD family)
MEKIVIIGGGSFLGNLINYIENMRSFDIVGYTDIVDHGTVLSVKYLGDDSILENIYSAGVTNASIAVGNNLSNTDLKQKIAFTAKRAGFKLPIIRGRNVIVHSGVNIGEGSIIRDGAIIQSNCKIGDFVMIGDNAVITHDTSIADFSQIVSGCVIGKGCKIGKSVFIGYSSVITNDLEIIDNCVIGAQSLLNKSCIIKGKYFGQPAKLKELYE